MPEGRGRLRRGQRQEAPWLRRGRDARDPVACHASPTSSISSATIWWPLLLCSITLRQRKSSRVVFRVTWRVRITALRAARLTLAGKRVGHDELAELLDKAVVAAQVVITLGRRRFETDLDGCLAAVSLPAGRRSSERRRQVAGHDAEAFSFFDYLYAEEIRKASEVTKSCTALGSPMASSTARRSSSISLALMAYWAKMLREAVSRSAASSTLRVTLILGGGGFAESGRNRKCNCCCSPALLLDAAIGVEEQRLGNGIDDALRVFREWDVDAGSALDLPHFAEKDIQHDSVDWVVCAVEETGFDLVLPAGRSGQRVLHAVQAGWDSREDHSAERR